MTIYVSMVKLTQEGVKGLRKWASTVDELKKVSLTMGVTIAGAYALVGPYDMMFISEADDEKDLMRLAILMSLKGVTVESMTAVPLEEFNQITESIKAFL